MRFSYSSIFQHSREFIVATKAIKMRIGVIFASTAIVPAIGTAGHFVFMIPAAPRTPLDQESTTASTAEFTFKMQTKGS